VKFEHRYPGVSIGTHAPDESIYRSDQVAPCVVCRAGTEWVHIRLGDSVCSEACKRQFAIRQRPAR